MTVTLREIQEIDAKDLVQWRNENAEFFPKQSPITIESHLRWFHEQYETNPSDHTYMVTYDGRDVGTMGLLTDTQEIQRVMLGDKSVARTGVMGRALNLLTRDLEHCWLRVLVNNKPAIKFYKKHGFVVVREQEMYLIMSRRKV
jgi:RimJ/RimL family protein N-acetyltransferase